MTTPSRIVSQVVWSYVSWGLIFITGPLSVALLTRSLSIREFGIFSLLVILIRVLPRVLSLGVPTYMTRTFPGRPLPELRQVLHCLVLAVSLASLLALVGGVALVWATGLFGRSELRSYAGETLLALLAVQLSVALVVLRGFFYANRQIALSHLLSLLDERLWLLLVVVAFLLDRVTLFGLLLFWNVGTACTISIAVFTGGLAGGRWRLDWTVVRTALTYGVPLLPFLAGFGTMWIVDRYILSLFHSATAVARFSLAQSISLMVAAIGAVFHGALFPYLSASRVGKTRDAQSELQYQRVFTLSTKYTALIVVPLAIGVFVVRGPLVEALSGQSYASAEELLGGMLLVAVLNSAIQIIVQDLMLRDATRTVTTVFVAALAAHVGISLMLVPRYGAEGSVIAGIVTHVVMLVAVGWCARVFRVLDPNLLRPARICLATCAMFVALVLASVVGGWPLSAVVVTGGGVYAGSLLLSGAVGVAEIGRAWRTTPDLS